MKKDRFLKEKYLDIIPYYGNRVLDVGAGDGYFAEYLLMQGHEVCAIDIVECGQSERIHVQRFDGTRIPFTENSFDTGVAMFVLHHCRHERRLLRELMRVTKDYVIIAEDVMASPFDRLVANIHVLTSTWTQGGGELHSNREWESIFHTEGYRLIRTIAIPRRKCFYYPVSRRVYVLEDRKCKAGDR